MVLDTRISRRSLLKAGAGTAAAAALASMGPAAVLAAPGKTGGRLIPTGKVGTITFTQRDVPGRVGIAASAALNVAPTMGYLGGPNIAEDPNDLGPHVPLPGGWRELFQFFASVGIHQVEFAGYSQGASNPGGAMPALPRGVTYLPEWRDPYLAYGRTLRGFLDEAGLEAIGNHGFIPATWPGPGSTGGVMGVDDYDRFMTELEFASILGMPFMGTGNDPDGRNDAPNRNIEVWTLGAEKFAALNTLASAWGIQVYTHNHSPAYNFLQDGPLVTVTQHRLTGAPITPVQVRGESGIRLMEYYLSITDPELVVAELDIYWAHVAQHQHRWYYDHSGNRVEKIFDPLALVASQTKRFPLYHAKDGNRSADQPGVGNGYSIVPFQDPTADIDFRTFFEGQGAKGFHNSNYEQDTAPGGSTDPGRSLRFTKYSAGKMNALRG